MPNLYDNIAMFESPVQILIVLTIALLVFGPKKLPEIGKQIGGALRELKKAAGDVSRSFSTDYEPETGSYSYDGSSSSYDRNASYYTPPPALDAPIDLSDYTMVGVTVTDDQAVADAAAPEAGVSGLDLADYTLTGSLAGAESEDAGSPEQSGSADGQSDQPIEP